MTLKLWAIAASFGDPNTNALAQTVAGTWLAESVQIATAQFCSKYYVDGGARHALLGISAIEITVDQMRQGIATIEKAEQEPPKVVPLAVVQQAEPPEATAQRSLYVGGAGTGRLCYCHKHNTDYSFGDSCPSCAAEGEM